MIVANVSHTLINCTCKNRLSFSLLLFTLIPQYLKRFNWSIQLTPLTCGFFSLAFMISRSFQTVPSLREAWKRGNICSVSVSFVRVGSQIYTRPSHVGRRNIQISPPLGEQDRSNTLPQGQQRQSNPHPMPCLPTGPAGFTLIGALACSQALR